MNLAELEAIMQAEGVSVCKICGTPYTPYHSRQKTCGTEECKKEYHTLYMRTRYETADEEKAERWREQHREANRRWRHKKSALKRRAKQLDKIIERTQKQADFDEYVRKNGLNYGKLSAEKTLAKVPKINVNIEEVKESEK